MFVMICRGLFEKHKGLFAFMIAVSVLRQRKTVSQEEWMRLLAEQEQVPELNPELDLELGELARARLRDLLEQAHRALEVVERLLDALAVPLVEVDAAGEGLEAQHEGALSVESLQQLEQRLELALGLVVLAELEQGLDPIEVEVG